MQASHRNATGRCCSVLQCAALESLLASSKMLPPEICPHRVSLQAVENALLMPRQNRGRKMQEAIQRDDHDISGPLSSLGWYQNGEWLMVRTAADRNAGQLHTDLTEPGLLTLWQHPRKTRLLPSRTLGESSPSSAGRRKAAHPERLRKSI